MEELLESRRSSNGSEGVARSFGQSAFRQSICLRWRAVVLAVLTLAVLNVAGVTAGVGTTRADDAVLDIESAEALLHSGDYATCAERAGKAIEEGAAGEAWRVLKIRAELAAGDYGAALKTLEEALKRYYASIQLRWIGVEVHRFNNNIEAATEAFSAIETLARRAPWQYEGPADRVTLGRYFLARGADARQVLELIYDRVKKETPDYVELHVATGDLALMKQDYALAAESFERALKLDPKRADVLCRLAEAFAPSDMARAAQYVDQALTRNPNHVESLLWRVDHMIDAEAYAEAAEALKRVLKINKHEPRAWAYRAVLAHLDNRPKSEAAYRKRALSSWPTNPEVDHIIGRKLSQKYRFKEGADYQRLALSFDPKYLPAKLQLSQDQLRIGEEDEGWRLAAEVHQRDNYNVVAYNLTTLHDTITGFHTIEDHGFIIRMGAHEAAVYGHAVLDLLERAKHRLCAKYETPLEEPIFVEIFPEQKDFAIRTFGLPGGIGFLGVCFGRVITANSPASQRENPTNWEAVLWHEFCHVVTLHKTRNKMPRWLSEGISVYEEKLENPTWGQTMTPQYREMILGDELTPVSQLSGAFLSPPSPLHLQFAYYESSLVVEYVVEKYGLDKLKEVLDALAEGVTINAALASATGSIEKLDEEFAKFARARAKALAPKVDWEKPPEDLPPDALTEWKKEHPNSFWGLHHDARELIAAKEWAAAKKPLKKLIRLHPGHIGSDSAYRLLALAHRELKEGKAERRVLEKFAAKDGTAIDVYLRLAELAAARRDWTSLRRNTDRILAVDPLIPQPYRYLAAAAEAQGDTAGAIRAYQALTEMETTDLAGTYYRLAHSLTKTGRYDRARRAALKALEEAPRYRDAHRLLLKLKRRKTAAKPARKAKVADKKSAPELERVKKVKKVKKVNDAERVNKVKKERKP